MIYTHIHTNQRMTIKKEYGMYVTCNLIDEPKEYNIMGELEYQTRITKKENLQMNQIEDAMDRLFNSDRWTNKNHTSSGYLFNDLTTTEPDDTEIEFDKEAFEEARELQQYRIDQEGKLQ